MARPSKYPDKFRKDALELVRGSGRPIADVARSLGISDATLWNWVKKAREADAAGADPDALRESEREELKRLRRQVIELEPATEILRRAAAYFARETMR